MDRKTETNNTKIELADVLVYALMFAHRNGFDTKKIMIDKMKKNGEKYPVEMARRNAGHADKSYNPCRLE